MRFETTGDGGTSGAAIAVGASGPSALVEREGLAVCECSPLTHSESCRVLSLFPFFFHGREEGVMRCCGKLLFESRQAKKRRVFWKSDLERRV